MQSTITSPKRFADWFNQTVPGAQRKISAEDVRLMTKLGLIGRCKYYLRSDIQTVIGILKFEQFRQND